MSKHGITQNSSYQITTMSVGQAKKHKPSTTRSLAYYRDDFACWDAFLTNAKDLAQLGIKINLLSNTETLGIPLAQPDEAAKRLEQFCKMAQDYKYYDNEAGKYLIPIHETETENEIDTLGWTDGMGGPITSDKIVAWTYALNAVAADYGIEATAPSFIGPPLSSLPMEVLGRMANDGFIRQCKWHLYGRSINNQPIPDVPGWINGKLEDAIDDILTYCGNMVIGLSEGGCWTTNNQQAYIDAFLQYHHPKVVSMELFAINDWCCYEAEYNAGRDFGIYGRDGVLKSNYTGDLVIQLPKPDEPHYVLGFEKFYKKLLSGGVDPGKPLENEFGAWNGSQQQETENGQFSWAQLPEGGKLTYVHAPCGSTEPPKRYRWDESWPTYQEVVEGQIR